jgi:N-acyl-D-aspartate/D-glutamate deacylase
MQRQAQLRLSGVLVALAVFCWLALPGLHFANGVAQQSLAGSGAGDLFDLVIRNARVMDPETHRDEAGMNVGIRGKTVRALTREPLRGRLEIDAAGRVAAPGFIDVLSYNPNLYGIRYKIADGVTTNLAMHGAPGTGGDMGAWYRLFERRRPMVNFGGSFLYNLARMKLKVDIFHPASAAQLATLTAQAEKAMEDGALGISMSLEYAPGITDDEVEAMMRVAHRNHVPVFFHARYSSMETPETNLDGLREIISLAKKDDVAVHIDHLTSTGGTHSMPESLRLLEQARAEGGDVTACAYPYTYWASPLNSARWVAGWQKRFGISYNDVQIAGTSERLTSSSFAHYRRLGKLAVAYAIPEDDVIAAMRSPLVMIGSDAILEPGNNNHPRAAGTFTRVLRVYVREKHVLTLMQALEKMTLMPARRLETAAPAMRLKGRLQVGADADIVVFDPNKVGDCSTVEHPNCYAVGMDYVLVNGQVVKDSKGFNERVRPGEAILNWRKSTATN